jgi:nucleoside-diphosphate-sugar epimerase
MLRVFQAAKLGLVPVFGDGAQELSLVYAPDLGEALATISECPATAGGIYYPCHSQIVTSAALIEEISRSLGGRARLVHLPRWMASAALTVTSTAARLSGRATLLTPDKANEFYAPAWTCDPAPLETATGWRATHDLAAGAAASADWYRSTGRL